MKKLGAITIDENNKRFKIDGDFTVGGKDGTLKKLAKGSAAVMTLGVSVAAEKAVKGVKSIAKATEWHDFSDLIGYKENMQNVRERQSGHSGAKVLGVRIGGSSSKIKNVTHSYDIIIEMNDLDDPFIVKSVNSPVCPFSDTGQTINADITELFFNTEQLGKACCFKDLKHSGRNIDNGNIHPLFLTFQQNSQTCT